MRYISEEALVNRLRLDRRRRITGEPNQRDCALPENRENQHQKTGKAWPGEPQMWLEEFAKSLRGRFGDLEIGFLSTTKDLAPSAIC